MTAPTEAPAGSHQIIGDFFKICGTILNANDVSEGTAIATDAGWEINKGLPPGLAIPPDISRQTILTSSDDRIFIEIAEHDGPHLTSLGCNLSDLSGENTLALAAKSFDDMQGFEGRSTYVAGAGVGRWTTRAADTVIDIFVMNDGTRFSRINMNKITLK